MSPSIWILTVVMHQAAPAVAFQEFHTKAACEAAGKAVFDAHYDLPNTNPKAIKTLCLPKGEKAPDQNGRG